MNVNNDTLRQIYSQWRTVRCPSGQKAEEDGTEGLERNLLRMIVGTHQSHLRVSGNNPLKCVLDNVCKGRDVS
jgi:hypothetical protein